ncbi:hypothetical protein PLICRDRAFT_109866 [Plicaturopsis crispa FD-325 SS-3]|nr:hypothetical protein PLICRDRAFT_109866 [Plicaturopsis crispa FD-325 SS-3]
MGIFNRASRRENTSSSGDSNSNSEAKKEKGGWRRPANTAFKQQRLKAWQPILTPKTVLPTLFIIGIIFAPIGGLLVWGSSKVTEITLDYTDCEKQTPSSSGSDLSFTTMPNYNYRLRSSDAGAQFTAPTFAFLSNTTDSNPAQKGQCIITFQIPADMQAPVFMYYKLTKFYQNHRRYVKSLDSDQLKGKAVSFSTISSGDCKPLGTVGDKIIYPCGLIANSVFNDTLSSFQFNNPPAGASNIYNFSETGIAWPGEAKKYASTTQYSLDQIVPPPNWAAQYPNNYTVDNPPPDLKNNEHFQNWMRTAGLPTFTKLYGRNDKDTLLKGTYNMTIDLTFPVLPYSGTKSVVISTVSWIGGKNPFLGWAYVAAAGIFVLLAIAGTARHLFKPRRLGDMSLLSWNQ